LLAVFQRTPEPGSPFEGSEAVIVLGRSLRDDARPFERSVRGIRSRDPFEGFVREIRSRDPFEGSVRGVRVPENTSGH